jgi:hypothetical protein
VHVGELEILDTDEDTTKRSVWYIPYTAIRYSTKHHDVPQPYKITTLHHRAIPRRYTLPEQVGYRYADSKLRTPSRSTLN